MQKLIQKLKKINKKDLMDQLNRIIALFDKDAVIYLVLLLAGLFFGFSKFVFPNFSGIAAHLGEFSRKSSIIKKLEQNIAIKTEKSRKQQEQDLPVRIYESPYKDFELENAAADLVNTIVDIIKQNEPAKIDSFNFEEEELKDTSGVKSKDHRLLCLKIQMRASYEAMQNILNELYLMEYLVNIRNVSLSTDEKSDNKTVLAYLVLELLIKI